MPTRPYHNMFAKAVFEAFGKEVGEEELRYIDLVNRLIDMPHIFLEKRHRILFHGADGLALAYALAKKMGLGLSDAVLAFMAHVLLDKFDSYMKRRAMRRWRKEGRGARGRASRRRTARY